MQDFGLGLLMHEEKKWATIKVFIVRKFLIAFLKDPSESSMDVKNLRFGQIMGAEYVVIRCMSSRTHVVSSQQEADG